MKFPILIIIILLACKSEPIKFEVNIKSQTSGSSASLRGLAVVDDNIAWVSGSKGTILRTIDGGENWQDVSVVNADSLDFRDIEAFSADVAIVLNAGFPGVIYKTIDGGANWKKVYSDLRPQIFFDAMDFWDEDSGIAFSDAIDGKIVLVKTDDGGTTWQDLKTTVLPPALENEGGFAASGTCLTTFGDSSVWIAMGAPDSRIFYSADRGRKWKVFNTPMNQAAPGAGIFSLSFSNLNYGLAVGGNYEQPDDTIKLISSTNDGGKTWQLINNSNVNGFKSAIANVFDTQLWLCTGPTGTSFSEDNGNSWILSDSVGYHALVLLPNKTGWLSGANGRIAKIEVNNLGN